MTTMGAQPSVGVGCALSSTLEAQKLANRSMRGVEHLHVWRENGYLLRDHHTVFAEVGEMAGDGLSLAESLE